MFYNRFNLKTRIKEEVKIQESYFMMNKDMHPYHIEEIKFKIKNLNNKSKIKHVGDLKVTKTS